MHESGGLLRALALLAHLQTERCFSRQFPMGRQRCVWQAHVLPDTDFSEAHVPGNPLLWMKKSGRGTKYVCPARYRFDLDFAAGGIL